MKLLGELIWGDYQSKALPLRVVSFFLRLITGSILGLFALAVVGLGFLFFSSRLYEVAFGTVTLVVIVLGAILLVVEGVKRTYRSVRDFWCEIF